MKRILIYIQNQLLATSIKNLLAPDEGFLINCVSEDNIQNLLQNLSVYRPDVLILDDSQNGREISRFILMDINCPEVRVIVANVDDNQLKIYERFEYKLSRSADFVNAIRWDFSSQLRGS